MAADTEKGTSTLSSLESFLAENPQDNLREEIEVSPRLTTAGFKFTISAPDGAEFSQYQKEAISVGRRKSVNFDTKRFNELLVINHTVVPNFRKTELIKKLGVATPEQALYRVLKAGEIQDLSTAIQELAGFQSDDELLDEAKN